MAYKCVGEHNILSLIHVLGHLLGHPNVLGPPPILPPNLVGNHLIIAHIEYVVPSRDQTDPTSRQTIHSNKA